MRHQNTKENPKWDEDHDTDLDLRHVLSIVLRSWYWYVIAVGIGLFAARYYLRQYTPIYGVKTTVLIMDEYAKSRGGEDIVEQLNMGGSKLIDNEMVILKSRPLVGKIVDNLGLTVRYWHEGENRDTEIYTQSPVKVEMAEIGSGAPFFIRPAGGGAYDFLDQNGRKVRTFQYGQKIRGEYGVFRVFGRDTTTRAETPPVKVTLGKREAVIDGLIAGLEVGYFNESSTAIAISIESEVPAKGIDILDELLEEYAFTTLETKNRMATNTLRFIEERLNLVSRELGDVEQDVERYRRSEGITDLSAEANLFLDRVQANDAKLNEIDVNLKVLGQVEEYVRSNQTGNIAPATMGIDDPMLTSYVDRLSVLEAERARLAQTVPPGNPSLETLNAQMRNVRQAINESLRNQRTSLRVARKSLVAMNNRLEGSIAAIPRKEREFLGIKRQAGVKENLYLLLLQRREETALVYASTVNDSQVVDPPHATPGPIRPDRQKIYNFWLLVSLAVPTALLFLREFLKDTVESKEEIEKKTGLKIFGAISRVPEKQSDRIVDLHSRSFISEQIRIIRSNLRYLFTDAGSERGRTILITSSVAGEGKTFVAMNLAASLALLDKRVLVLGLDMRKPKVNDYLTIDNKVGLSNYLIGQADEVRIVKSTTQENLYVAPSGPIPPNPSELLSTGRIADLVGFYRSKFDYIVIDTPPVGLVTDALLLAPLADTTFYVVRHEKTTKAQLATVADLIGKNYFKSFHIIFNAVDYKNVPGYAYGYASSSYYGEDGLANKLRRGLRRIYTRSAGRKTERAAD